MCVECSDLRAATRWNVRTVAVDDTTRCGRLCVRSGRLDAVAQDLSGEDGRVCRRCARLCERCDELSNEDGRLSTADDHLDHRVRSSRSCVSNVCDRVRLTSTPGAIE